MTKQPAVYMLASKRNGTLYIGMTSNLQKRAWEHKNNLIEGFTKRYGVHRLVYCELHPRHDVGDNTREADEKMEPGLESGTHRATESGVERFMGRDRLKAWIPAFAGMTEEGFCKRGSV